jgi:TolB protein
MRRMSRPLPTVLLVLATAALIVPGPASSAPPPRRERAATLPFVSPDGKHIVYTRDLPDHSAELVVIDATGGNPRTLVHDTTGSVLGGWMSGGRQASFILSRGDTTTFHRVPVSGGSPVRVLRIAGKSLRLSNDGRRITYAVGAWTRGRLVVADADGSHARAITDSTAGWFNMAWSPDDRRIAVTRLDSTRALAVWVLGVDGTDSREIATFPDSVGRAQWPSWSPDGKRVALQVGRYDRNDPSHDRADIWVVDVATGATTNLMPGDDPWIDETPSWSPDGRTIVFQSTRSGRFEVWRMNADGSSPVQLTRP